VGDSATTKLASLGVALRLLRVVSETKTGLGVTPWPKWAYNFLFFFKKKSLKFFLKKYVAAMSTLM
jgi:hypothetical protein